MFFTNSPQLAQELGMPLGKILELPIFAQSRILAGREGVTRLVTGVNVMEVPDIINWVKPGQLLVTTGFAIKDNLEAQKSLVPSLARQGLAGICIKPRRYLDEIPLQMLTMADEHNFPLIELSPDIGFADLIHAVLSAILHEQSASLLQMLDVHSALMKIMIEGGGLKKIAGTLATLVNNTVYIMDIINNRWAYHCVNWPEEDLGKLLEAVKEDSDFPELAYQTQGYRGEVLLHGTSMGYFTLPLLVANECYGYIRIWETTKTLNNSDINTIERLSTVAALEIARERSLQEVEHRYYNEFLNHLLGGRIDDEGLELQQAKKLGWNLEKNYVVSLVWPLALKHAGTEEQAFIQEAKNRVLRELPRRFIEKGIDCLAGTRGDYLIILLAAGRKGLSARQIDEATYKQLESVLNYLRRVFNGREFRIGLGRFYPGIKGLQKSYQEAKQALRISENFAMRDGIISFNSLGLYRFIYSKERDKEVQAFLQETVMSLVEYDQEKNTELINTLRAYFEHHGNLKKVSEALFTHYNTILYRLERIQAISGLNLDRPEDRFNLEMALKLLPVK